MGAVHSTGIAVKNFAANEKPVVWRRVELASDMQRGGVKMSVCNTTAGVTIIKVQFFEFRAASKASTSLVL